MDKCIMQQQSSQVDNGQSDHNGRRMECEYMSPIDLLMNRDLARVKELQWQWVHNASLLLPLLTLPITHSAGSRN